MRVEVEFNSEDDAKQYTPLDWFGTEITNTKAGWDKNLIQLNRQKLLDILDRLKS